MTNAYACYPHDYRWDISHVRASHPYRVKAKYLIQMYSTDNLGAAILALPNSLRWHSYQTPSDITDTAFTDAHPEASHIFEWFENNPKNMQNFNLWMDAHRLRSRDWLDIFPFQDLVPNGRDTDETATFVDIAGGIGYQCRVNPIKFDIWMNLTIR